MTIKKYKKYQYKILFILTNIKINIIKIIEAWPSNYQKIIEMKKHLVEEKEFILLKKN